ncbi:hypothetical protein LUZ60_000148 [Juncus effusus]|nr:hypothetical protein LUZ60_000148 [Juncus effusus]
MLQRSVDLAPPPSAANGDGGGNVDRQLYKNLVELVPLVESLVGPRVFSAYSRRAPMVYTPAPSKSKKTDVTTPSTSAKKLRDISEKTEEFSKDQNGNVEKYTDEIAKLREQIEDLQKKLFEKEEALKIAENSVNEMNLIHDSLNDLKFRVSEKEALLQSTNQQLNNAKVLLAEKQATLEKLEWEVEASNCKIVELQDCLNSTQFETSSLTYLFEKLCENDPTEAEDFDTPSFGSHEKDGEMNNERLEEEMKTYLAALNAAKENQTEEYLNAAFEARSRVCSFIF